MNSLCTFIHDFMIVRVKICKKGGYVLTPMGVTSSHISYPELVELKSQLFDGTSGNEPEKQGEEHFFFIPLLCYHMQMNRKNKNKKTRIRLAQKCKKQNKNT